MFPKIVATPRQQSGVILSWSHYDIFFQLEDKTARDWYEKEAAEQTWSVRTLQRNIFSQYYYRMLKTQKKELVENEMKEITAPYQKFGSCGIFGILCKYRFYRGRPLWQGSNKIAKKKQNKIV